MGNARYLMTDYIIREIKPAELHVLAEMLYQAIFRRPGDEPFPRKVIKLPAIDNYINSFGKAKDDYCLVADRRGTIVGAVWIRILAGETKGYGYVDDKTPEFAVSVLPEFRNHGIGKKLMKSMIAYMKRKGYSQGSLSVQKNNYAYKMYKKLGFETVRENGNDCIMVKTLNNKR